MGLGEDRIYYARLDRWLEGWAQQYDDADANDIAETLELNREFCEKPEGEFFTNDGEELFAGVDNELVLDLMLRATEPWMVREGASMWYTGGMRPMLDLRATLKGNAAKINPRVYREHVQPYIEAARPAAIFVNICAVAHTKMGSLHMPDINRLFNHVYGGLEGFLASERRMRDTYGPAAAVCYKPEMLASEDVRLGGYHALFDQLQTMTFRAVLKGIDEYRPTESEGGIRLDTNKGSLLIVAPKGDF